MRLNLCLISIVCTGILYLLLYVFHLTGSGVTAWSPLEEVNVAKQDMTIDHWRCDEHSYPPADYELLAAARTDYTIGIPILSELFRPTHGHHIYFQFRLRNERLKEQLLSDVRFYERKGLPPERKGFPYPNQPADGLRVWPAERLQADGPRPGWWQPKYFVEVTMGHEHLQLGFDPEKPDIVYDALHYEWSPISGD